VSGFALSAVALVAWATGSGWAEAALMAVATWAWLPLAAVLG